MATQNTLNERERDRNPQVSLPVIATAEPITIFHYEVMSVSDSHVSIYDTLALS